jgi:hypothetical protein
LSANHVSHSARGALFSVHVCFARTRWANSDTRCALTLAGDASACHVDVTILHAGFANESATTVLSECMTVSTQTGAHPARKQRAPRVVWLLVSSLLAACSLLAPSDEHYLSDPSRALGDGGDGGEAGEDNRGGGGSGGGGLGGTGGSPSAGASAGEGEGEGGNAGSDAGASSGGDRGDGVLVCAQDLADCNQKPDDGCEVDLSSSKANCGGCGEAFACGDDEVWRAFR